MMAFPLAEADPGGIRIPVLPFVTTSAAPPTSVTMTGLPADMDLSMVRDNPSLADG